MNDRRNHAKFRLAVNGHLRALGYFLTALVSLSVAATCIESGLHPLMLVTLLPLAAALNRQDYSRPYVWSEKIIAVLLLVYAVAAAVAVALIEKQFVVPRFVVYFAFGALAARILSPLDQRGIGQVICLTAGMVLINCILTNHLLFGLILPFYLFSLMGALALSYMVKIGKAAADSGETSERLSVTPKSLLRQLAKSAAIILAVTVAVFALIPRPFLILPGLTPAMASAGGLGDLRKYISYRDMAGMGDRQRVAFFVEVEKGKLPNSPYWRGRVLDRTDGQGWQWAPTRGAAPRPYGIKPEETFVYKFTPYRLLSQTIYAAGLPLSVLGRNQRSIFLNSRAESIIDSPFLITDSYTITGVDRPVPASRVLDRVNIDKSGITPNIERLSREWTSGIDIPAEQAKSLASRLRTDYTYVLDNPLPPENAHPVEHFLFKSRQGNCEYFAGALCMMLRSLNIPSRIVEGFAGMEETETPNQFLVRFARGHAWVEALLGDGYWTTLDPTPSTMADLGTNFFWRLLTELYDAVEFRWNKYVVHFDRADQILMVQNLVSIVLNEISFSFSVDWKPGALFVAVAIGGVIVLAWLIMLIKRARMEADLSAFYLKTMRDLTRRGILQHVDSWHERNVDEIVEKLPLSEKALANFMAVYLKARFRPDKASNREDLGRASAELLDSIERSGNSAVS
jgi:protein-glutamine gamma-glutamyltransferase